MKTYPRHAGRIRTTGIVGAALVCILWSATSACDSPIVDPPDLDHPCVSWCNTVAPWPHDGNPLETDWFTIYTDGASREALQELATIAKGVLRDLMDLMEIEDRELFVLPPGQAKFHLYAYRYHDPHIWGGQSFWGGMIVFSRDHRRLAGQELTEWAQYTRLVVHEMMHVLQNSLVGSAHSFSTHTWFEEGLAELVSAVDAARSVTSRDDFDALVAEFGELNPISITNDILPDIPDVGVDYFYPMFELTMRYVLSEGGLDGSLIDVKETFLDMRSGSSFEEAFESRFGVSVSELEAEYFDRLRTFLE